MRFTIVSPDWEVHKGGIEFHAFRLAQSLRARGHQVQLTTPRTLGERADDVDWLVVEGVHRASLLADSLRHWGYRRPKTVLFTHGSFYEFIHEKELGSLGFKSYPPGHKVKKVFDGVLMKNLLRRFDKVYTLAESESRELGMHYGVDPKRMRPLDNFANPPASGPRSSPTTRLTFPERFVSAVGRIDDRKNFISVVEAIRKLPVHFVLGGSDVRGSLPRILSYAKQNQVENFHYVGAPNDEARIAILNRSIATVLPSYFEGVPFAVLESLSMGKPAVCTPYSYMKPRRGMILCEPDPSSIRRAIVEVMERPPEVEGTRIPSESAITDGFLEGLNGSARNSLGTLNS